MLLPLAHGSWIELIVWLAWQLVLLAVWLIVFAVGSLVAALIYGTLLLKVLPRGRFLLLLMPLINVGLFLLIDPVREAARWLGQGFFGEDLLRVAGAIVAGICGLIAAAFLAGAGRVARGVGAPSAPISSAPQEPTLIIEPRASVSRSSDFRHGIIAPVEGLRYLAAHRGLWRYAILPIVLNVLITGLVLLILVGVGAWFAVQLHPSFAPTWWGTVLEVLAGAGILVVALALAAIAWLLLNGILCGHFYAKLARRVELQLGTPPDAMREVPLSQQIADTFRDVGSLLVINIGLLLLNIVPLIGTIAALGLGIYFDGFIFGRDYLDYPMSLRGMARDAKLRLARAYRWQTIGLGAGVFAFNLVPIIGSVLNAGAAVGAVLLFHRWPQAKAAAAAPARAAMAPA